ncbi:uncharacterized protein B0H18DRAFT_1122141 [Fomitopsis serialis]|uniref:uncharacterized protein n=1 Tax=Fomitopsis serialis TaxID=139415 RepID=UPI0020089677|nr:uncharacterized protein B0H18DRAFT_1122141 [Neoantrodia serialis]KAH9920180.1 hypothetical protein B0H18DRAFT_1122141 [Neoantrodia serialis]
MSGLDNDQNSLAGTPPSSPSSHSAPLPPGLPHGSDLGPRQQQSSEPGVGPDFAGTQDSDAAGTDDAEAVPTTSQKRRAPDSESDGDMSQYTGQVSRHFKLKRTDADELTALGKRSIRKILLYNTGQGMKTRERLDAIQPANAVWEIPKRLWSEIEYYTYAVLCSPVLPTYVSGSYPVGVVLKIVSANPGWGYTPEVKNDKQKQEIVAERVRTRLTDRRSAIKTAILLSIGPEKLTELDAMHLTKPKNAKTQPTPPVKLNILQLAAEVSGLHRSAPAKLTLELCARIAYLRRRLEKMLQDKPKNTDQYWKIVDKKLVELRKGSAVEVSRMIQRGLREDQDMYGTVDANEYEEAASGDNDIVNIAAAGKSLPSSAMFLAS